MKDPIVITWSEAQQQAQELEQQQKQVAKKKLEEFLESDLGMLDVRDLEYYAELTGKTANELRQMHPENNLQSLMFTYGYENDDILSIY